MQAVSELRSILPRRSYYRAATYDTPPPADHVDVVGKERYYLVSLGHRIAYVKAADVRIMPGN